MTAAMYFLSKDCYVCNTQNYWIVLNAKRDKYLCVTHADLASIRHRLHGWRDQSNAAGNPPQFGVEADALITSLTASGIITGNPSAGKPFVESECPLCERSVEIVEPKAPAKRPLFCVARFFLACARIDWYLRKKHLSRILARIERRRIRVRSSTVFHNVTCTSRLIEAFEHLRPLYPRPYLCLFESLALVEFLASYRSFPRVVIGVIADPFQAHCWLQEGNVVLNDDLERILKYKPILST
jgi:hypothetical protein